MARLVFQRLNLRFEVCPLLLQVGKLRLPIVGPLPPVFPRFLHRLAGESGLKLGNLAVDRRNLCLQPRDLLLVISRRGRFLRGRFCRPRGGTLRCAGVRRLRRRGVKVVQIIVGPDFFCGIGRLRGSGACRSPCGIARYRLRRRRRNDGVLAPCNGDNRISAEQEDRCEEAPGHERTCLSHASIKPFTQRKDYGSPVNGVGFANSLWAAAIASLADPM